MHISAVPAAPGAFRAGTRRRAPVAAGMSLPLGTEYDTSHSEFIPTFFNNAASKNNLNNTFTDILMEQLALTLNVYYTPLLIVLGCVGNLISIIVFFMSKLWLQSTSQYLTALAISDTLFLCQLLPPWLKAVGASELFSRNVFCQVFVYLSYVTSNLSSWLVVAFTVERFVAVLYPLQRNSMCSVKRARYIIATLTAVALLINVPVLRFAKPSGNDCNIDELLMAHAARFNMVDTVFSFTLPMAIIVVLNAWIMAGVYRLNRIRKLLMRQQLELRPRTSRPPRPPQVEANHQPTRAQDGQQSQQRVTRMLLIVSTVFVIFNVPAYTMRIIAYANNMGEHEYSGKWAALQQIGLLFFNTNFGINFLLYCLTGQNFRKALEETYSTCVRRRRQEFYAMCGLPDRHARGSSVSTSHARSFRTNEAPEQGAVNNAAGGSGLRRGGALRGGGAGALQCGRAGALQGGGAAGALQCGRAGALQGGGARAVQGGGAGAFQGGGAGALQGSGARSLQGGGAGGSAGASCQYGLRRNAYRMNVEREPAVPVSRRRRSQQVIQRWRFDNSRQLRNESIEMRPLPGGNIRQQAGYAGEARPRQPENQIRPRRPPNQHPYPLGSFRPSERAARYFNDTEESHL